MKLVLLTLFFLLFGFLAISLTFLELVLDTNGNARNEFENLLTQLINIFFLKKDPHLIDFSSTTTTKKC